MLFFCNFVFNLSYLTNVMNVNILRNHFKKNTIALLYRHLN